MISGFVLVICMSADHSVFSKRVGYQIGPEQTIEECNKEGAKSVEGLAPIFNGVRYVCRPRTKNDFVNLVDPNEDKDCK